MPLSCTCVCVYTSIYVCLDIYTHTHVHVYLCICSCIYLHLRDGEARDEKREELLSVHVCGAGLRVLLIEGIELFDEGTEEFPILVESVLVRENERRVFFVPLC